MLELETNNKISNCYIVDPIYLYVFLKSIDSNNFPSIENHFIKIIGDIDLFKNKTFMVGYLTIVASRNYELIKSPFDHGGEFLFRYIK